MIRTPRWTLMVLFLIGITLVGFVLSFRIEQAGGGYFEVGSSYRADQEGTRILYESLERIPGVTVQRNAEPWKNLVETLDPDRTLVVQLNCSGFEMIANEDLMAFLEDGGRFFLTPPRLVGGLGDDVFREIQQQDLDEDEELTERQREQRQQEEEATQWLLWDTLKLERLTPPEPHAVIGREDSQGRSPPEVKLQVRQFFASTGNWDVVAEAGDRPMLLRKTRAEGELLVLADEGLLLNGRLFTNPPAEWLSWLIGDAEHVVFQEGHLGKEDPQSLTALMWQHRIGGLLPALAIPFLLLLWRACLPFLPVLPAEEEPAQGPQGRVEGMRDLLARYIGPKQILHECLTRWAAPHAGGPKEAARAKALQQGEELLRTLNPKEANDLPGVYTRLDQQLNQKRKLR